MAGPRDDYGVVCVIFFVLGCSTLFPWNTVITETLYFALRFDAAPVFVANNFESIFSLVFQGSNLCSLYHFVRHGWADRLPVVWQVPVPLLGNAVLLGVFALLTQSELGAVALMTVTLLCIAAMGILTSFVQGGAFGLAGRLPPRYTNAAMTGQALSGVAVSLVSFVTQLVMSPATHHITLEDVKPGAFAFYLVGALVVGLGAAGYGVLQYVPFYTYHTSGAGADRDGEGVEESLLGRFPSDEVGDVDEEERMSPDVEDDVEDGRERDREGAEAPAEHEEDDDGRSDDAELHTERDRDDAESLVGTHNLKAWPVSALENFVAGDQVQAYRLAAFGVFFVTLSVFPQVTSSVCSVHNTSPHQPCDPSPRGGRVYGDLFTPLTFLLFNIGDFVGRLLAGVWPQRAPEAGPMLVGVVARTVLMPLLLLCNVIRPHSWALPRVFRVDTLFLGFLAVLAVSNGYMASIAMMHAPSLVPPHRRAAMGSSMAFSLTCGIASGSMLSLVVFGILQN